MTLHDGMEIILNSVGDGQTYSLSKTDFVNTLYTTFLRHVRCSS